MSSILEAVAKGTDLKHFNERKERVPNNFDDITTPTILYS